MLTLWRFISLPDLSQHRLRALFPLVGIALGVAVFIAVRVTNHSTLGAFERTVEAIAGRAGLEITGRGAPFDEALLPLVRRVPGVATVAPLILADEPTANLDSNAARQIVAHLRALADSGEHGVLLATHDLRTASQADRVLTLRDGQIVKETILQPGRSSREVLAELA